MLVRITNHCDMGCPHCMVEASPDGQHMTMGTFEKVIPFVLSVDWPIIMLSGGEPTDHPDLLQMIDKAIAAGLKTLVLSNGKFVEDESLTKELLSRDVMVQVTNDPEFYPRAYPKVDHPKVTNIDKLILLSPFGRAVENKIECGRQSPLCFNLRSATRAKRDLREGISLIRERGKMCTPSVNIDGSVSAGESPTCSTIGTVEDSNARLTNSVCQMRCSRCGLVEKLSFLHKNAIGEVVRNCQPTIL